MGASFGDDPYDRWKLERWERESEIGEEYDEEEFYDSDLRGFIADLRGFIELYDDIDCEDDGEFFRISLALPRECDHFSVELSGELDSLGDCNLNDIIDDIKEEFPGIEITQRKVKSGNQYKDTATIKKAI